jgi:hypothetical protein
MQLSLLLPVFLYFFCHYPKQSKVGNVVIVCLALIVRYIVANDVYNDMQANNMATIGMVNPARNIVIFSKLYSMPLDQYIAFVAVGAFSGLIFFYYIEFANGRKERAIDLFGGRVFESLTLWKKNTKARTLILIVSIVFLGAGLELKYLSST